MQISPLPIAKDLRTACSIHGMARLVAWQDEIERTQIGQPQAPQKDDVLARMLANWI
jgi:hypothetical protein